MMFSQNLSVIDPLKRFFYSPDNNAAPIAPAYLAKGILSTGAFNAWLKRLITYSSSQSPPVEKIVISS